MSKPKFPYIISVLAAAISSSLVDSITNHNLFSNSLSLQIYILIFSFYYMSIFIAFWFLDVFSIIKKLLIIIFKRFFGI